jgi:hypothetical protein
VDHPDVGAHLVQLCRNPLGVMRYSRNLWIAPGGEGRMAGVKKAAYPSV